MAIKAEGMANRQREGITCLKRLTLLIGLSCSLFVGAARAQEAEFERHEIDVMKTKCEVCKTAVKILFKEVEGADPHKVVEIGSFRLQADGTTKQRKVPYRGSEVQLQDLVDDGKICGGMKDYVPVTDKETGLPTMINMAEDMDQLGRVKFNPNPDFNSKMNTLCEEIIGDHDEALLKLFKSKVKADGIKISPIDFGREFCIETANLCDPDDDMARLKPKVKSDQVKTTKVQFPENDEDGGEEFDGEDAPVNFDGYDGDENSESYDFDGREEL